MWQYNYTDELCHHGVKGQRWGVRRTREQLGYKDYVPRKGDVTLDKGHQFQRITTNANTGYTKGVYTSYRNSDKDLYKGVLGRMRLSYQAKTGEDVALKETTMTAKKPIRIPSKEVRIEEFKKLAAEDPEGVAKLISDHETSRFGKDKNYTYDDIKRNERTAYQKFNDALAFGPKSENGRVISRYYLNLKKLGYDAIPDENDIRLSTFKAKAPIIMFDINQSISSTKTRDLSASEVFGAYSRSVGKKAVRDVFEVKNIGFERLKPDTVAKSKMYTEKLEKDKRVLNPDYSLKDLANDWQNNRLTSSQIRRVSDRMDQGMSHDDAVAETISFGNVVVDKIMNAFDA